MCHKWHYKIAKALVVCLESKDFVQIRNSLIVLTKIIQHFPVIQNLATVIEKRVDKVKEIDDSGKIIFVNQKIFKRFVRMKRTKDKISTSKPGATRVNWFPGSLEWLRRENFTR